MKRFFIIFLVIILSGCSFRLNKATLSLTQVLTPEQILSCVPDDFEYVSDVGNGWYLLSHETGKYLFTALSAGSDIHLVWIGD